MQCKKHVTLNFFNFSLLGHCNVIETMCVKKMCLPGIIPFLSTGLCTLSTLTLSCVHAWRTAPIMFAL